MSRIRRILCPTDFSECSHFALHHAIRLAKWSQAGITGLHVVETIPRESAKEGTAFPGLEPLEPETRQQLQQALDAFLAVAGSLGIRTESLLKEGTPAREIVAQARALPADLLVMGTHGREGFERFMLGSVTEKVVRRSPCPVLTVSRKADGPHTTEGVPYRSLLIPVDFSESSKQALAFGIELAVESGASLTLAHVVEVLPEWETRELAHFSIPEFARHLEREALGMLRAMVPEPTRQRCHVEEKVFRGKAWAEILRAAEECKPDLIVMGTHGRNPLDLAFFGSTTSHVVRGAVCPVLTIRAR